MGFTQTLYNNVFKRTSTFFLIVMGGTFFFEAAIDGASDAIFNSINKGKLWHQIKDNYTPKEE